MAERTGARVPAVLAAGPSGPSNDALLVTHPPSGRRLSKFAAYVPPSVPTDGDSASSDGAGPDHTEGVDPSPVAVDVDAPERADDAVDAPELADDAVDAPDAPELADDAVDDVFGQLLTLRRAGIAHGSISTETIVVSDEGRAGFVDFRAALTVATADDLNRDMAAALAATAVVVGPDRAIASVTRCAPPAVLVDALPFLQRAALDPSGGQGLAWEARLC